MGSHLVDELSKVKLLRSRCAGTATASEAKIRASSAGLQTCCPFEKKHRPEEDDPEGSLLAVLSNTPCATHSRGYPLAPKDGHAYESQK